MQNLKRDKKIIFFITHLVLKELFVFDFVFFNQI